jgi:uncharacterized membrane protein YgcG
MRRILLVLTATVVALPFFILTLSAPPMFAPRVRAATLPQQTEEPQDSQEPAAQDDERIRAFDSHITVHQDRSMEVTETITVQSAGVNIRHGIYRDFPTRYKDRLGNRYSVTFDVVSLERDGSQEAYHTDDLSNGVRVYFGRSSYELPPGVHTYKFTYRTSRQLGFFKDHDELYWNVTGVGWMFPIDVATATVVLPAEVRGHVKELDGYTGSEGAKDKNFTSASDREGNPTFRAEKLLAYQGLTLVVAWPKGLIPEPTAAEKRRQFIADNRAIVIGVVGLVVVWLYYIAVWSVVGRDPRPGTLVPLYEPQDNLSAAGMRFLERMGFDDKVFTSAILGLAAKGYLTIDNEGKTYRLLRKHGYGTVENQLSADEKVLAQKLFSEGDKVSLTEHNARLQTAQKALESALDDAMERKYFRTNVRFQWAGVALTALTVIAMVVATGGAVIGVFMSIWLTGWSAGVTALMVSVFRAWKSARAGAAATVGAVFITLFSLPFVAGECFGIFILQGSVGILPVVIILAGVLTSLLFHYLLKAPTLAGRALMDHVEGFRMFLQAVDGDRINRTAPVAKTPELFERFLPFALALGVEHAWAQQFSQVLAAAAGASSQGGRGYAPSWYSGAGFSTFSPADFTSSFSSSFSGAVSSASAPASSSSGSGGGGSSGGGGGGGGGGGW